eukprot:gene12041-15146_t
MLLPATFSSKLLKKFRHRICATSFTIAATRMASSQAAPVPFATTIETLVANPGRVLLLDGGTGEELLRRGVPDDRKTWSATAVVNPEYHDILCGVHKNYYTSGSGAVATNSFGITPGVGFSDDDIRCHVGTAGRLARKVADELQQQNVADELQQHLQNVAGEAQQQQQNVADELLQQQQQQQKNGTSLTLSLPTYYVCGSLGPLLESYRPDKILPHARGREVYEIMVKALSPYIDSFLAETMGSFEKASQDIDGVAAGPPNDGLLRPQQLRDAPLWGERPRGHTPASVACLLGGGQIGGCHVQLLGA